MFCAGLATFAQLYSPQAVLPAISADLAVPPARAALLVSTSTGGLALSVVLWSWAADRWGRIRTMIVALALASLSGLGVPLLDDFTAMAALRFVEGACLAGVAGVAVAHIAEETHPAAMTAATGLYISGTSIGGLSGRLVSGPLTDLTGSWRLGVGAVVGLSALAAVAFAVLVPPSRRFVPERSSLVEATRRAVGHLRNRRLVIVFVQAFCLMGAFVTVYNYIGFHLEAPPFGLSPTITSLLFLSYLAGTWSAQTAGRFAVRIGRRRVLLASTALMPAGLVLTLVPTVATVVIGLVVLTAGFFAGHAVASALGGSLATEGRVQATALYNLFYYLGSSVLGWSGGYVYEYAGWPALAAFCAVFLAAAMVSAGSGLRTAPGTRP